MSVPLQSEKLANIRLELSTRDKVFENIRFKHFSSIFSFLSNSAKQLRQSQAKAASMNVNQMKDFVQQNLRDLQQQSKAIAIHIGKPISVPHNHRAGMNGLSVSCRSQRNHSERKGLLLREPSPTGSGVD